MVQESILIDEDYKEKTEGAIGILVFHKKLCPNCRVLNKMLIKFFDANPEIYHWSVDSEENPEVMGAFGIERVPTIVILKNGSLRAKKVGLFNIREMAEFCKEMY